MITVSICFKCSSGSRAQDCLHQSANLTTWRNCYHFMEIHPLFNEFRPFSQFGSIRAIKASTVFLGGKQILIIRPSDSYAWQQRGDEHATKKHQQKHQGILDSYRHEKCWYWNSINNCASTAFPLLRMYHTSIDGPIDDSNVSETLVLINGSLAKKSFGTTGFQHPARTKRCLGRVVYIGIELAGMAKWWWWWWWWWWGLQPSTLQQQKAQTSGFYKGTVPAYDAFFLNTFKL